MCKNWQKWGRETERKVQVNLENETLRSKIPIFFADVDLFDYDTALEDLGSFPERMKM